MLLKQQRRKPMATRGQGNRYNPNHHKSNNNNNGNSNGNGKSVNQVAKPPLIITSVFDYPSAETYGSYDYPLPTLCKLKSTPRTINNLPSFTQRQVAILENHLLSTFKETAVGVEDQDRRSMDSIDPAMKIVLHNTKTKSFKLELDTKRSAAPSKLLVNKFLTKDGLNTPMKRTRDELIEVSSSVKKNRRVNGLQADTTMELSFEGKAMDKSDLVKLIDSSGIMQDDSHLQDYETSQMNIDTRNLLQSTEFNFEYKR